MTDIKIDYETLAQDALRSVVRTVLVRVSQGERLPGNHHFYISFSTTHEGVGISKRLRDQYPSEMTIVLQHRYWDLQVHDDRFEVKLTFNSIPERLVVPFSALKVFFDPSVPYGLQFDGAAAGLPATLPDEPAESLELPQRRVPPKRTKPTAVKDAAAGFAPPSVKEGAKPLSPERTTNPVPAGLPKPRAPMVAPPEATPNLGMPSAAHPLGSDREKDAEPVSMTPRPPGQVVQLDTFRKK